jgi:hypothetical protein
LLFYHTSALSSAAIPEGWTKVVHPEGARYFANKEKVRQVHGLLKFAV